MAGNKSQNGNAVPIWAADVACRLLEATTTAEVDSILKKHSEFGVRGNWRDYGNAPKNWDRVGVQTSEPVGALAEVIINSIDAILMRKAQEAGINEKSPNAPHNMREAVKHFFPDVTEGRLSRLSARQRTELAENCIQIAIKRGKNSKKYPTYTVVDFGEGQNPGKFPNTLLSLGAKNKEGIPFVQGRFNMGSTGSITFCTRADIRYGMYKFILSKRTLADSDGHWGWTLVRVRHAAKGEVLPVAEYFAPNGCVPTFKIPRINAFSRQDIGVVDGGTIVKLYEYDIGPIARGVDFGLHDALTTSLIDSALPIRLFDFDAKEMDKGDALSGQSGIYKQLRAAGIAPRTFSGMSIVLRSGEAPDSDDEKTLDLDRLIAENSDNPDLGTVRVYGFGMAKMKDHLRNYPYRVFYTINGQTQAKERASFFRKANLDDLRNHLIVQVDCNSMNNTARSVIFKPDRERKADTELTRELEKIIVQSLKDDDFLREYALDIRRRRVKEQMEKDETSKEFFRDLVKDSPELKGLFGKGDTVDNKGTKPRHTKGDNWKGEKYPTFLNLIGIKDGGSKVVPINAIRKVECATDAENEYLSRNNDPGEFVHPPADMLPNTLGGLRNGKLRITLRAPKEAQIGDEFPCEFGFRDSSRSEPLIVRVLVQIGEAEKPSGKPGGKPRDAKVTPSDSLAFPDIIWVKQDEWDEYDFNEESGATIRKNPDAGVTIYVNQDNRHLSAMLMRESEEAGREMCRHLFRFGVGILTLAMYKRMVDDRKVEETASDKAVEEASAAIAAHVVTIIRRLGGKKI